MTAVVVREDDRWKVSRWIDAELEPGDGANTLDDVIRIADASVRDSYPPGPRRTSAELQYAIYPWKLRGTPTAIFDITGTDGGLIATDILERNPGIRGKTADDLVAQASLVLARQDGAMFRWVKNVNDLAEEN